MSSYRAILLDPPWAHVGGGRRGAQEHYQVLSVPGIVRTILTAPCWSPDLSGCHVWLWCPAGWQEEGLEVLKALGASYKTQSIWLKDRWGMGQYVRHRHEPLLFGIIGRLRPLDGARRTSTIIGGGPLRRREHSRKPDEQYAHIEAISPGPYLEMFARHRRDGWDQWGQELPALPETNETTEPHQ